MWARMVVSQSGCDYDAFPAGGNPLPITAHLRSLHMARPAIERVVEETWALTFWTILSFWLPPGD
jgi:hypothetical protein